MQGEDQFGQYKRSADIEKLIEENKNYISKKQKCRLKKRGKNALINEEHEGTLAPHECPLCGTEKALFYHYGHETDRFYYKCGHCSLIFVPRTSYLSEADEASRYELHDNDIRQPGYRAFLNRVVEPLVEALTASQTEWDEADSADMKAIARLGVDFGCGPGPSISIMMKDLGYDVINYDPQFYPHPDMDPTITTEPIKKGEKKQEQVMETEKEKEEKETSNAALENDAASSSESIISHAELLAQPTLTRQYRFITCTEVIEHVKNPLDVWEHLYKMLAPGGILAIMTGVVDNDQMFQGWHYHRDPTHICFYHKSTLEYVEKLHGWTLTRPSKNVSFFTKNK